MAMKKNQSKTLKPMVIVSLAAVVFVAAGLWFHPISAQDIGVTSSKTDNPLPTAAAVPPPTSAKSHVVADSDVLKEVILTGELQAARSTIFMVPNARNNSSFTISTLAPEGALIKKGDLIVQFDDSALLSQKADAERSLGEAELSIEKQKTDLESQRGDLVNSVVQAQSKVDQDMLYAKIGKDLLSSNDYQKYQLNLQQSNLSLQKAKEQLDNFEANYQSNMTKAEISRSRAELILKWIDSDSGSLKIYAPQDGILIYGDNWKTKRRIQPGDSLMNGQEVARLPDLSDMQVIGYVYDTEYSLLGRDMRGTITLDALPGFQVQGKIISLTNVADLKNFATRKKVFKAVVQLDKADPLMKPGMTARVRIPIVLAKKTIAIPREYLGLDSQGRFYVFKGKDPKTASIQFVKLGVSGDRMVQIASGLSLGDPLLPLQRSQEVTR
jgi:HlyD family secretion protein